MLRSKWVNSYSAHRVLGGVGLAPMLALMPYACSTDAAAYACSTGAACVACAAGAAMRRRSVSFVIASRFSCM